MCIITGTVSRVAKTKIYVSADTKKQRQITIYSNEVNTPRENAMVLPVPHPETVDLVDLSSYPELFGDCATCFRLIPTRSWGLTDSDSAGYLSVPNSQTLEVLDVGSYRASLVPSLNDFARLDTSVFQISPELIALLTKHYVSGFGFIVCQLKSGNHLYHPFAYTHALADNGKLFVPTRHFHPHEAPALQSLNYIDFTRADWEQQARTMNSLRSQKTVNEADWDHVIYSPLTDLDSLPQDGYYFVNTTNMKWDKLPQDYWWASKVPMRRWTKHGDWKNEDLWATSQHNPADFVGSQEQPLGWWDTIMKSIGVA